MRKYVVFLAVMVAIIATGVTNVAVRIQPIKDWRLKNERINFSLVIDNIGDTSVYVATNAEDVFLTQLYCETGELSKKLLQTGYTDLLEGASLVKLNPLNQVVTDIISEFYKPLYATNGIRKLEFNLGGGIWFDTEIFTNNIPIIIPTHTNQLGQYYLQMSHSHKAFTTSFFEVTLPSGERWVYEEEYIPICRMRPGNTITITQTTPSDWVRITDGVSVVLFNCRMLRVEQGDAYATPHWQWIQDERRKNR